MRIIVVEDDPDLRRLYIRFLQGHEVISFSSAENLLTHQRWFAINVAIVDLMYKKAKTTGFDLLAWLKDEAPAVRRVLVTGGYKGMDRESLEKLADVVLIKPVDQAMLIGAL